MLLLYLSLVLCVCTVCQAKGLFDIISRDKGQRPTWSDFAQQVKRLSDLETMQRNTNRGLDCVSGLTRFEGSCYCLVASRKTWFDAKVDCQRRNCYLAEIESQSEDKFLGDKVQTLGADYWIGATDEDREGHWVWYHSGKELSYTNWYPGEPNNAIGQQHYAYISYGWSGTTKWDDHLGSACLSYICEC